MKSFNQYLAGKMGGAAINEMDGAGVSTQDMGTSRKIEYHTQILLNDLNSLSPAAFKTAYGALIGKLNELSAAKGISMGTTARQAKTDISRLIGGKYRPDNDPNLPQ